MNTSQPDDTSRKRALACEILPLPEVSEEEYLQVLKDDWNTRAATDPSSFVAASSHATDEDLEASGRGDVLREFTPRAFPTLVIPGDFDTLIKADQYMPPIVPAILEIGCGMGRMSQFLSMFCDTLVAADISSGLLELAKKRVNTFNPQSNVLFVETDGRTLAGVPSSSINIAFEYIVFQHIPNRHIIMSYIRDVNRVLVTGGIFIMHGRDVSGHETGTMTGNTWHGCRCSPLLVREATEGTSLVIVTEEGIGTDRYWATLQKKAEVL